MAQPSIARSVRALARLVAQMEKGVNEAADPGMKSDEFASVANKVAGRIGRRQGAEAGDADRYFGALNLPTRSDVDGARRTSCRRSRTG